MTLLPLGHTSARSGGTYPSYVSMICLAPLNIQLPLLAISEVSRLPDWSTGDSVIISLVIVVSEVKCRHIASNPTQL